MFEKYGRDLYGNMVKKGSVVAQVGSLGRMRVREVRDGEVLECGAQNGQNIIIEAKKVVLKG